MPKKGGKIPFEEYDPTRTQFNATVQGIYESLVKKEVGASSSDPFHDEDGDRLDELLDNPERSDLLSSAFAIATKQGQKHGYLHKGTQTATKKGRQRSRERQQSEDWDDNQQDYEETLALTRQDKRRIVKEGPRKFVVYPEGVSYPSAKSADKALKRMDKYDLVSNPWIGGEYVYEGFTKWDLKESFKEHKRTPKGKGRGAMKEWGKYKTAKAIGSKTVPPARGRGTGDFSTKFYLIKETRYPEQFYNDAGDVEEMYKYAPYFTYYTIQVQGFRFQFYNMPGYKDKRTGKWRNDVAAKYPHSVWKPAAWAASGLTMKNLIEYENGDGETIRRVVDRTIGDGNKFTNPVYMEFNVSGGVEPSGDMGELMQEGFNPTAITMADDAVWQAEAIWSENIRNRLFEGDEGVTEYLMPIYPKLPCGKDLIPVNDPRVHIGVLVRALKAMELLLKQMYRQPDGSVEVPSSVTKDVYNNPVFKDLAPSINKYLQSRGLAPIEMPGGQGLDAKLKGDTVQSYRERYEETKSTTQTPLLQLAFNEDELKKIDDRGATVARAPQRTDKKRRISMKFTGFNQAIKAKEKTLTTRKWAHGLEKGERAQMSVAGVPITVESLGALSFQEAMREPSIGGVSNYFMQEAILPPESFIEMPSGSRAIPTPEDARTLAQDPQFKLPKYGKDWIAGKGKLYLFRLIYDEPAEVTTPNPYRRRRRRYAGW